MLTRSGPFDEDELAEAAKSYLPLYGKEKDITDIPYKDLDKGKVNHVRFTWLAGQWIFTDIIKTMRIIILSFLLFGCVSQDYKKKHAAMIDSSINAVDTIVGDPQFDTIGIYDSGVEIVKSRVNAEGFHITYKNISDKDISGIRFKWIALDAFHESEIRRGVDVQGINLGKTATVTFSSHNIKKIEKVWPVEIAFEDGSKWESSY